MARQLVSRMTAVLALSALAAPAAQAATVSWATGTLSGGAPAPALIGAPDASTLSNSATVGKFYDTVSYPALASTMGLTESELMRYDVLAWEGNGGSPAASGGWESASWVFRVPGDSVASTFNELTGTGSNPEVIFRTGSISAADYMSLFGAADPGTLVWSWLLVDLPTRIDVRDGNFLIDFAPVGGGVGLGEGTPDPDAIGVLNAVPAPPSWALLLMAAGLAGLRRVGRGNAHCAGKEFA